MSCTPKRFYPFEEAEGGYNPLKKLKTHYNDTSKIVNEESIVMSKNNSMSWGKSQSFKQNEVLLKDHVPLAERMKPVDFDSYIGQKQVIGSNTVLRCLLEKGEIPSMIFWGPPGCGKTSLVNVIIQMAKEKSQDDIRVVKLVATASGVGDIRKVVETAKNTSKFGHRTILCMDEIHSFNKLQQDIFLPHVEAGTFILIGTTTENPSYSLNSALLSRCRLFALNKLSVSDVNEILKKGIHYMDGRVHNSKDCNKTSKFIIHNDTIEWLAEICDGDARIALNGLELTIHAKNLSRESQSTISLEDIKQGLIRTHTLVDKPSEQKHHLYSALHKSICAGKANASLYWLARIMAIKEDPVDIARRLVRISSEDVGLADPDALGVAVHTLDACQMIGMPECDVMLAQCVIYLVRAPKSRLIFNALEAAKKVINNTKGPQPGVPQHIKCRSGEGKLQASIGPNKQNLLRKQDNNKSHLPESLQHVDFFHED
ncbi:hypothetical protein KPH14_004584 [Odynerus spinipes]|uniref:AAA+ ATPase domain-containing protein n=1 Tax=Odynerus spinipes TaxID=1348599 RepID=A0AAD9RMA6_9HYME|nr:hypothetical protein KPH14_004584 [Odynerus spinipes]